MEDMGTVLDGAVDNFEDSPAFDGERRQTPSGIAPNPNNLTLYRWRIPILTPGEEADEIRKAKAGDGRAKDKLVRHHHRTVLKIASKYYGPSRDDLIAAGHLGIATAIDRFDTRRNNGFNAFARDHIRFAIAAEAQKWRKRGQAGETRIDRWLYHHHGSCVEDIVEQFGCTKAVAEASLVRQAGYWDGHEHYDTAERGLDDDADDKARRFSVGVDTPPAEVHPDGVKVTDDDWNAIVAYRAREVAPWPDRGPPESCKPISRSRYVADQVEAHRIGAAQVRLAQTVSQTLRVHASNGKLPRSNIERELLFRYGLQWMADEIDRRELRRLNAMGRSAYALELVERDRKRIEARANPDNYLYPDALLEMTRRTIRRKATEAARNRGKPYVSIAETWETEVTNQRNRKPRRTQVWRSEDATAIQWRTTKHESHSRRTERTENRADKARGADRWPGPADAAEAALRAINPHHSPWAA
jgi:hypothetical protein